MHHRQRTLGAVVLAMHTGRCCPWHSVPCTQGGFSEMMHMYACSAVLGKAFQSYYPLHSSLTSSFSIYITGRGVARDAGPDVTCLMWTQSTQLADCTSFFSNHICLLGRQKNTAYVAHGTPVYESTRLSLESPHDDLEPAVAMR